MVLDDFYYRVKRAKENDEEALLLIEWRGHPCLRLDVSTVPVLINKYAAYRSDQNGWNSLEDIFESAARLNREVPFTCLIDTKSLIITETIRGPAGTFGLSDWNKGVLLKRAMAKAKVSGLRIMLGHTHPPGYGSVCSNIQRPEDSPFGGDFTEMWEIMKRSNLFSRFHIIMTPRDAQVGVFELKAGGRMIYHPLIETSK